jgi:FAD/FMN-containing dehydrogenase/Fe-S oxidoreductase
LGAAIPAETEAGPWQKYFTPMPETSYREIPYNYTSATDEQVVTHLFGAETWSTLEELRATRVTGRSARLLLRFMGDMFILRRNPFLWQWLVESHRRRRNFFRTASRDIEVIERNTKDDDRVRGVLRRCREYLRQVEDELSHAPGRRQKIRRALGAIVGEHNVAFDPFAIISHATDATDWRLALPLAVVWPAEESQVAALLRACADLGLRVIPRGAGTGLTGGAVPLAEGCVMVNTERLNRIGGIRAEMLGAGRSAAVMDVEAGVITEDAMAAAEKQGLVFATDPTSAWASTIGGNLAENAGGKSAVLWGTAIDNVLSFRVVMPGGVAVDVARVEHPLRKILPEDEVHFRITRDDGAPARDIVLRGNDLRKKSLWKDITNKTLGGVPGLQKEGTDGVITSARFVLYRAYEKQSTACLEFFGHSMDEASQVILALSREIQNRGDEALLALEHFDEEYVRAIGYRVKATREERPKAVLLIDLVAREDGGMKTGRATLEAIVARYPDTELFWARDEAEAKRFWADRKRLGAIARHTNAFKLNEDVVLPLDQLASFARYIDDYNLAEERFNHERILAAIEAYLGGEDLADAEWFAARRSQALHVVAQIRTALAQDNKNFLRDGHRLADLESRLSELFSGQAAVVNAVRERVARERSRLIIIATHMHAGDGNVHVNIPVLSNDRFMMVRAADTADTIMRHVVALGGVVSGEHGIGITKLKHLEPERVAELDAYRAQVDPQGLMNPGKLADTRILDRVFTPSFNLLELEARILKHGSLKELADKISKCVRCGKCKPVCCVFNPPTGLYYHPRNKNLAIGSLIEALMYEAGRFRSTEFTFLRQLENVADHCTVCHKCKAPCPVDIDTGEVSLLERRILVERQFKHTALPTRMTLTYLGSRNRVFNSVFRRVVLGWGTWAQRRGAHAMRLLGASDKLAHVAPLNMLSSPVRAPSSRPLYRRLPKYHPSQSLLIHPADEAQRTVFYFPGCGSERLYSDIGEASLFLLLRSQTRVVMPPRFLCCGFPFGANAKTREQDRRTLANAIVFSQIREMLGFLDFAACVVSCGTCREALGAMGIRDIFSCPIEDVSGFVIRHGLHVRLDGEALYHRPCHDSLEDRGLTLLRDNLGTQAAAVPHCCSEAGTLSLSRPDIAAQMLAKKADALREIAHEQGHTQSRVLTNCPSCIQGLSRQPGLAPQHLAVALAEKVGGPGWRRELETLMKRAEVVNY